MLVDYDGNSPDERKPSVETLLHTQIYRHYPEARAVLHGHGVYSTLMSQMDTDILYLRHYELLKMLAGTNTHAAEIAIPLFANDQDIARLAKQVDNYMNNNNNVHAYLIAGHGFYVWGESIDMALHRAEAFEFLMACEWKKGTVKNS
jgi:methylthioribulose-1-phosphate dehydratase